MNPHDDPLLSSSGFYVEAVVLQKHSLGYREVQNNADDDIISGQIFLK